MGPAHTADISLRWAHRKREQIGCCWQSMAVFWHSSCAPQGLIDYSIAAVSMPPIQLGPSATLKLQTIGGLVGTAWAEREGPSLTKVGLKRRPAVSVSSQKGRAAADIDETFKRAKLCWTGHQLFELEGQLYVIVNDTDWQFNIYQQ